MFPMKLITDYKIHTNTNEDTLASDVEKNLKKGWTLLGAVQVTHTPEGLVFTQVMIKVADK